MKKQKILACVDQSKFANYVSDYAAWAADSMNASLEIFHVIDRHPETAQEVDHSGAIGLDAQANLMEEIVIKEAERNKAIREKGRIFLNKLSARVVKSGGEEPDVRQRYGSLEEGLLEQEKEVDLFVFGRLGESAEKAKRDLGRHVERMIRTLKKPILTVASPFKKPKRMMIAFDGGSLNRKGVQFIKKSHLFEGLSIQLLMCVKSHDEARSKKLDQIASELSKAGFDVEVSLMQGDPKKALVEQVKAQKIDFLVMGAYKHSPFRRWFLGSKTNDLLRLVTVPTLLLR